MLPINSLLLLLLLLLLFSSRTVLGYISPAPAPAPSPSAFADDATEFIRVRCDATLYKDLCLSSLAQYAGTVRGDPVMLSFFATNVTIGRLRSLSARAAFLRRAAAGPEASALADCADTLRDAADLARKTAAELRGLCEEAAAGAALAETAAWRWRVSNAQTWMSAALTNEETCTDGLDGGGAADDVAKADVRRRAGRAKEYTSNALALVNGLVGGGR